jgi:hypothetical protein
MHAAGHTMTLVYYSTMVSAPAAAAAAVHGVLRVPILHRCLA